MFSFDGTESFAIYGCSIPFNHVILDRDLVLSVPDFSCVSFVQQGQKKLQRAAKYTTATGREHSVKKELAEDKSKSMTETPKETPKKKSRFSLE